MLKAFPVVTEGRGLLLVLVRGDHRINEIKLTNALGEPFRPADGRRGRRAHRPARLHRAGRRQRPDPARRGRRAGRRLRHGRQPRGRAPARRRAGPRLPVQARGRPRRSRQGTRSAGRSIRIEPAIEVGNIFKLGTRYSEPLNATVLDASGKTRHIWMGSYGIGPARIMAAAVEQYADEAGHLLAALDRAVGRRARRPRQGGHGGARARRPPLRGAAAEGLQRPLRRPRRRAGREVRRRRAAWACPLRLTVGRRTIASGEVEAQVRRGRETRALPLEGAAAEAAELWRTLD